MRPVYTRVQPTRAASRAHLVGLAVCVVAVGVVCATLGDRGVAVGSEGGSGSTSGCVGPQCSDSSPSPSTSSSSSASVQIVMLGTGTPNPLPDYSGPATALIADGNVYLFDMGPGVMRRLQAAANRHPHLAAALNVTRVKVAFLTHLHSDHTTGYPDTILNSWVMERTEPMQVYGPNGTIEMTENILNAYQQDIHVRIVGLEPISPTGYTVDAHDVKPDVVAYADDYITVTPFEVIHGIWQQAFGFRIDTWDGKRIVISGDTIPVQSIVDNCDGCDVLIHEVYGVATYDTLPADWQAYYSSAHTSSAELCQVAIAAQPSLLVLYHHILHDQTPAELLAEVESCYDGAVVFGEDLDLIDP